MVSGNVLKIKRQTGACCSLKNESALDVQKAGSPQ